jgi:Flagellar hook-length control protein FliK
MKIDPLVALPTRPTAPPQLLLLQGDADFAARLTLGQIIKGRVLRAYEQQRYAVEFDGQRRTVDSAVPLTVGETVHGRVIGLGEQVTLQRIRAEPGVADEAAAPEAARAEAANDRFGGAIAALFERYQAKLQPAEWAALQRLAARVPQPQQAALAGLVLNKVGLQIAPELFRAVHAALAKPEAQPLFALPAQALSLAAVPAARALEAEHDAVPALAGWLGRALADVPEAKVRASNDDDGDVLDADGGGDPDLARWILNAQTGGAVTHRVATLPLLLDGELVELDVALFAQNEDAQREPKADGIRHRELVFALTTEALGHIEVRALLANGHLRLRIAADSGAVSERLAEHAPTLEAGLQRIGWQVDEQRYESRVRGTAGGVIASVVDHLISPGSVSRLV